MLKLSQIFVVQKMPDSFQGWSLEQIFFSTQKSILNENSGASFVLIFRMVGPGLTLPLEIKEQTIRLFLTCDSPMIMGILVTLQIARASFELKGY